MSSSSGSGHGSGLWPGAQSGSVSQERGVGVGQRLPTWPGHQHLPCLETKEGKCVDCLMVFLYECVSFNLIITYVLFPSLAQVEHLAGRHVIQVVSLPDIFIATLILQKKYYVLYPEIPSLLISHRWLVVPTTVWPWFAVYLHRTTIPRILLRRRSGASHLTTQ